MSRPADRGAGYPRPDGRVPPYSQEAEVACLGAILLSKDALIEVSQILEPSDFYVESHRRIYDAMIDLVSGGHPVDVLLLGDVLRRKGDLEKIGGAIALSHLTDVTATSANVGYYARIVREKAQLRTIIYAAQEVAAAGLTDPEEDDFTACLKSFDEKVSSYGSSIMPESLFKYGDNVLELYQKVKAGFTGIPFPWDTLTDITMGQWPGTMTVFVARPGVGKTMVAVLAARHAWLLGKRVLIVSPEMSKEEIAERFFVIDSGTSYGNVMRGTLTDFEFAKLKTAVDKRREEGNFWILDAKDDLTGKGIDAAIRACDAEHVGIDAIYRLRFKGDKMERTQSAMDWLGLSTKRYGYAACAFSQLNRGAEAALSKGGGSRLGTIALTDQIGWDVHAAFAMEQDKDMKADKKMRVVPMKVRRGSFRDEILMRWDFETMNFDELPPEHDTYEDDNDIPF